MEDKLCIYARKLLYYSDILLSSHIEFQKLVEIKSELGIVTLFYSTIVYYVALPTNCTFV